MLLSNLEYIPLRLLRRFVFRDELLLRWGRLIPYYRTNLNQIDPARLVDTYARHITLAGLRHEILEIGVGATNSTGYELAARNPNAHVTLLEPFVALDVDADARLLAAVASGHGLTAASLAARVRRLTRLEDEPTGRYSLILSSSVLEHVADPAGLFRSLARVLAPGGTMLHLVDYRDHFFKYPLHFLQFRRCTWERWLNPGDLPRWRIYDHIEALEATGFTVTLPETRQDPGQFSRVRPHLSADFRGDDPRTGVTFGALLARHR